MILIKLIPVGIVASAGISFFSPISANADSIFVEGQILIAGAGSKAACEAKGKYWKPKEYVLNNLDINEYSIHIGENTWQGYCDNSANKFESGRGYCSCQKK